MIDPTVALVAWSDQSVAWSDQSVSEEFAGPNIGGRLNSRSALHRSHEHVGRRPGITYSIKVPHSRLTQANRADFSYPARFD